MATSSGIVPFIILGIVVIGLILYVVQSFLETFGVVKPHKKHFHRKIRKTHISNKFKELYTYLENKYLPEIEKHRKKLVSSMIIFSILFSISFIFYMILIEKLNISKGRILGFLFIPPIIYDIYKYKKYNKIYTKNFKEKILKNFVETINHTLSYYPDGGKQIINYYLDANFEDKQFNSFVTDDYIIGRNENNTKIQMCNISLENVSPKGNFQNIVYEGIFSVTKLNTYITGELRIKNNSFIPKEYNNVKMDSIEFEKYFDVYSNSNVLAMEILTHDIMEELVIFYNTYKINFEIIIKNDNIYIRFDTGVMFEPNILRKVNDINTLWIYYNVLNFVTNFTIKLNKLLKDLNI